MRYLLPLTLLLFGALEGPAHADLQLSAASAHVTVTGTDAAETVIVTGDGTSVTFAVPSGTISKTADPDGHCGGSAASITCTATAATVDLGGGADTLRSPSPVTTSFAVAVGGGPGRNILDLSDRTAGVTASPAGIEGSALNLQGIQDITGTPQDDTLTGNTLPNHLRGGAGADKLQGGQGEDLLEGGGGADVLRDTGGFDAFFGDAGDDQIFARDEFGETVNCGDGDDTAEMDESDAPDGCETLTGAPGAVYVIPVATSTPTPASTVTTGSRPLAGTLRLRRKGAKLRKRALRTRGSATCAAAAGCRLKVISKFGTRTRKLGAGRTATVTLRLSRKAARRLRRGKTRRRRVVLRVRLSAADAATVAGRVKVTLRA